MSFVCVYLCVFGCVRVCGVVCVCDSMFVWVCILCLVQMCVVCGRCLDVDVSAHVSMTHVCLYVCVCWRVCVLACACADGLLLCLAVNWEQLVKHDRTC